MAYNLTIDQGNTAIKLALWDDQGALVNATTRLHFTARDVAMLFPDVEIGSAIYCTVSRRPPTMIRALQRRAGNVIEFTPDTPTPLALDYTTPHSLGLDRLAAAVGAFSLPESAGKELLVVDLGTAITYDRVTANAHYTGGNIAPGIFMRLKALNHYTARLPLVDPHKCSSIPAMGNDTRSALLAGAVRGVVAELEYYHGCFGENTVAVLTGGYAEMVEPLLSFKPVIEPNLVCLGLNKILEYNYNSQNQV